MKGRGEKRSVLVGEKEMSLLSDISSKLRVRGIEVIPVKDGSKALEMALLKLPDLMILDTDLEIVPTAKLTQIVRSNPKTGDIPVIYISGEEKSVSMFRQGVDEFIRKPFNVSEFILKVARMLSHGSRESDFVSGDTEVSGRLSQISLPDLLQMFAMNRRSGVLHVEGGTVRGTIYLDTGKVVSSITGSAMGEKAFYRLISLQDGEFQFVPGLFETKGTIEGETHNLILEGVRRVDEMAKVKEKIPSLSSHVILLSKPSELPVGSNRILKEILMLLDFYSRVEDIVNASNFPDFDVYELLMKLEERGFIKIGASGGEKKKREFFDADTVLKVRSHRLASFSGKDKSAVMGRITFFIPEDFVLEKIISALKVSREFELDRFFFAVRNVQETPLTGTFGYLNVGEEARIALLSFRCRKELSPLWYSISRESLGSIIFLKDEVSSSLEDLLAVSEFARAKGNGTMLGIMSRSVSNFGLGENYLSLFRKRAEKLGCELIVREVDEISFNEIQYGIRTIMSRTIAIWEGEGDRSSHSLNFQ